jgi:TPR repeat protein
MLKRVLAGLIVAIMMSSAAVAGPLEDGHDALVRGDYALAVKWYHLAANQGHAEAQVRLGALYALGEGCCPAGLRPCPHVVEPGSCAGRR